MIKWKNLFLIKLQSFQAKNMQGHYDRLFSKDFSKIVIAISQWDQYML